MSAVGTAPRGMKTFLIIWLGELISIIGSGMTSFAVGVWIFRETGQATPFALTVLFGNLPRILILPVAGMLADRWNRRWLMILADLGAALTTLVIVVLLSSGQLVIWHIYLLVVFSSIFSTFQEPAYRASVTMLVSKENLARASGMMSAGEAATLLVSPLLAGLLFGVIGMRGIILIDFATFFFAVGALVIVRIPQPRILEEEANRKSSLRADTAFAWRYLLDRPGMFWMMWYFALVNFALNFSMVLYSPMILSHSDAGTLGLVQVVSGVGMMAGSIAISAWGGPKRKITGVVGFIVLAALGMGLMGLRPSAWLTAAGFFVLLFSIPIASGCSQAITQAKIEPSVQGRVMAMRGIISQSMMPVAFLLAGPLADRVFGPLLIENGALSASLFGQVLGVGPGRGIGLIFIISCLVLLAVSMLAWSNAHIRNLESELPDVEIRISDEKPIREKPAAQTAN